MDFTKVENLIKSKLTDAVVEVTDLTGTRDHLGITVTSDAFKGKALLAQHRLVMDILKEALKEEIHAVKIKTNIKNP
jgi:stress-induced morphogen